MAEATQEAASDTANIVHGVSFDALMEAYSKLAVEVVNGEFVAMTPNQRTHAIIIRRLFRSLDEFAIRTQAGEVFIETTFVLDGDPRKDWIRGARQPDVSFIAQERVELHDSEHGEAEGPWWLAPDLAVEIVLPTDKYVDVLHKVANYIENGVQLVWVINPSDRTIRVHTPDDPDGGVLHEDDSLSGDPALPGWEMQVGQVCRKTAHSFRE